MPIPVICSGCKTSFQVSEKFAGKQGPCPKCKAIITIPAVGPEIKIHAPTFEGPKDSTGRPVFNPILREEIAFSQTALFGIVGAVVMVLVVAVVVGLSVRGAKSYPPPLLLILGAIALAPPLGFAGYAMLRDQESTPYRGRTLWIRIAASSAVYALLWAAFVWLPPLVLGIDRPEVGTYSTFQLLFIVPIMVGVGGLAAYVAYDLEFGQAAMHYGLYLSATVILSLLAGVNWIPSNPAARKTTKPAPKKTADCRLQIEEKSMIAIALCDPSMIPGGSSRNRKRDGRFPRFSSNPQSPICNPQSATCNPQSPSSYV